MKTVFATDLCGFMDFSAFNIKQSPMFAAYAYNECVYFDTIVGKSLFSSLSLVRSHRARIHVLYVLNLFCFAKFFFFALSPCLFVCVCMYGYYCAVAARFILFTLFLYEYVCFVFVVAWQMLASIFV